MGIALNLSINLLRIDLFNRLNLAIHEHSLSPFIRSLISFIIIFSFSALKSYTCLIRLIAKNFTF